MKICPKCGKTYSDPSLNFCLDDGSILNQSGAGNPPQPTVLVNQPRSTDFNQFGNQTVPNNQFAAAQNTITAKKSSKTWLWVVGILGAVTLLCGGGLTGLYVIGKMSDNDNKKENSNYGTNLVNNPRNANSKNSNDEPQTDVTKVDLSRWVQTNSKYGKTEYKNDEFFSSAIKENFYYVLAAPAAYKSSNATTKITVRDAESGNNKLGYGLIINSNPVPLIKDYAFLINAKTQKYRVVSHTPGKEKVVINWKDSKYIKSGSQANVLEVADDGSQLKFYINGELVETVSGKDGYAGGVPGVYVGGTSPVAFSNLEIRK